MRILIDLQGLQADAIDAVADLAGLDAADVRDAEWHVLLNAALPGVRALRDYLDRTWSAPGIHVLPAIAHGEQDTEWVMGVSESLRAALIDAADPDVVVIPAVDPDGDDAVVLSVARQRGAAGVVMQLASAPAATAADGAAPANEARRLRRHQDIKCADRLVVADADTCDALVAALSLDARRVHLAPGDRAIEEAARADGRTRAPARPGPLERRPRLAFLSPLPPENTGIADYNAELLPELARDYSIEVVTPQDTVTDARISANFPVRTPEWFEAHAAAFDRIVYQIGNSPYHAWMLPLCARFPGTVVLHDFFLGHLQAACDGLRPEDAWRRHGYAALRTLSEEGRDALAWSFPHNLDVLENAAGVIVHTDSTLALAREWYQPAWLEQIGVVPLQRRLPPPRKPAIARGTLGVDPEAFLVCCFGRLGVTKSNHRLIAAWRRSGLAARGARLVFVGGGGGNSYTDELLRDTVGELGRGEIAIMGHVSADEYTAWLDAADVAVQLREGSRGEAWPAVLDCLAHGRAVIANRHGSSADLPAHVLRPLAAAFDDQELATALIELHDDAGRRTELGRAGRAWVERQHHPEVVGRAYRQCLEAHAQRSAPQRHEALIESARSVAAPPPAEATLRAAAHALAYWQPGPQRQLLVDVSAICRHDLRTGIQRVVRAQVRALVAALPPGFRVEPVRRAEGGHGYRYARDYAAQLLGLDTAVGADEPVEARPGDIFFGADLDRAGAIAAVDEGLLARWRVAGIAVYFQVFDILPITRPACFPPGIDATHERWLRALASVATGLIGISAAVARSVAEYLERAPVLRADRLWIGHATLGADIEASAPTTGLPVSAEALLAGLAQGTTVLMVGTVEPRKGYDQVLDAFERLWEDRDDWQLVIVGAEGWRQRPDAERRGIPALAARLQAHPERGRRLHWIADASDEYLERLYRTSDVLLMASADEGFGLPLVEAARHQLPIVARDIPVFREVAGDAGAWFFTGESDDELARALGAWHAAWAAGQAPDSTAIGSRPWSDNAERLYALFTGSAPADYCLPGSA